MNKSDNDIYVMKQIAEEVRNACITAMQEGFQDASMSGLCTDGAVEAAIGAVQLLNLEKIVRQALKEG